MPPPCPFSPRLGLGTPVVGICRRFAAAAAAAMRPPVLLDGHCCPQCLGSHLLPLVLLPLPPPNQETDYNAHLRHHGWPPAAYCVARTAGIL